MQDVPAEGNTNCTTGHKKDLKLVTRLCTCPILSTCFLSISPTEKGLNHRNLFHPQWITSISRPLHIYTFGFPMKGKGIRLESGQQYLTTLLVYVLSELLTLWAQVERLLKYLR